MEEALEIIGDRIEELEEDIKIVERTGRRPEINELNAVRDELKSLKSSIEEAAGVEEETQGELEGSEDTLEGEEDISREGESEDGEKSPAPHAFNSPDSDEEE